MLSILIPAYNEATRIQKTLIALENDLSTQSLEYEILVINDGSTDDTRTVVDHYAQTSHEVKVHHLMKNKGKGYAIVHGMKYVRGDWVVFIDADYPTPISYALKFISYMEMQKCDMVFGSRRLANSVIHEDMSSFRQMIGKMGVALSQLLLQHTIQDTQCGFKVFSRKAVAIVSSESRVRRFGFDMEIIFLAKRHGLTIAELPVDWTHDQVSTVHTVRDTLYTFIELLSLVYRKWFGR